MKKTTTGIERLTTLACLILGWTLVSGATPAAAQGSGAQLDAVLNRLGIPTSTLDGVEPVALEVVCQGSQCDIDYTTLSDEACRAVAVDVALRRRAEQLRSGGSARVLSRVQCTRGVFAVFQTSARRAVIGHRDSAGNTAQREIPL